MQIFSLIFSIVSSQKGYEINPSKWNYLLVSFYHADNPIILFFNPTHLRCTSPLSSFPSSTELSSVWSILCTLWESNLYKLLSCLRNWCHKWLWSNCIPCWSILWSVSILEKSWWKPPIESAWYPFIFIFSDTILHHQHQDGLIPTTIIMVWKRVQYTRNEVSQSWMKWEYNKIRSILFQIHFQRFIVVRWWVYVYEFRDS